MFYDPKANMESIDKMTFSRLTEDLVLEWPDRILPFSHLKNKPRRQCCTVQPCSVCCAAILDDMDGMDLGVEAHRTSMVRPSRTTASNELLLFMDLQSSQRQQTGLCPSTPIELLFDKIMPHINHLECLIANCLQKSFSAGMSRRILALFSLEEQCFSSSLAQFLQIGLNCVSFKSPEEMHLYKMPLNLTYFTNTSDHTMHFI